MNTLTHAELKRLAGLERRAVVSLYVPQHTPRSHEATGPTTLKNLRRDAETKLLEHGWRSPDVRELLRPIDELIANDKFWSDPYTGLALFVGPDLWELRVMHSSPAALVWVGRHPYLKPLWAEVADLGEHYVLTIHQHGAHLYRGDRFTLEPMPLGHLPEGVRETLGVEGHERGGQLHTGHPGLPGKQALVFHGQGGAADAHKEELIAYLRQVDHAVQATIGHTHAPVVFVGVEFLFPLFRDVSSLANLWPTPVHGSSEHWPLADLHRRTLTVLEPQLHATRQHDVERFERGRGGDRVSANVEEIVRAATDGQVEAVFVAADVQLWGEYNATTGTVSLAETPHATIEDLLDRIATITFINGGRVHVVPAAEIPGGLVAAALYRYPRPAPVAG